jgi:hypothetical protein
LGDFDIPKVMIKRSKKKYPEEQGAQAVCLSEGENVPKKGTNPLPKKEEKDKKRKNANLDKGHKEKIVHRL